ncbi:hypothetical protein [Nocardia sp. NPDC046763]|uniref:hypothetical protein n=1 Tax=Nocardia sp. NPDC046763 TaxID=3155256 RepID=UPI0033CCDF4F
MTNADETRTHALDYAAERIGCRSEDWLLRQVRARKLPARKVGTVWRMTDADIAEAIHRLASPAILPAPLPLPAPDERGLTPSSRRRLAQRARKSVA